VSNWILPSLFIFSIIWKSFHDKCIYSIKCYFLWRFRIYRHCNQCNITVRWFYLNRKLLVMSHSIQVICVGGCLLNFGLIIFFCCKSNVLIEHAKINKNKGVGGGLLGGRSSTGRPRHRVIIADLVPSCNYIPYPRMQYNLYSILTIRYNLYINTFNYPPTQKWLRWVI